MTAPLPRVSRIAAAIGALLTVAISSAGPAAAHSDVDFTLPADGASVVEPVSDVTIAFTEAVELVGAGFEALDPQGNLIEPVPVTSDSTTFVLQFDPPLAGGAVGIRYEVRAQDGHVIDGSFTFTVDAPVPSAPTTAPPAPTTSPASVASTPSTSEAPGTAAPATSAAPDTALTNDTAADDAIAIDDVAAPAPDAEPSVLGDSGGGDGGNTGVFVAIAAAVAVGAAGFLLLRSRTGAG